MLKFFTYKPENCNYCRGGVQPKDRSWIIFFMADGTMQFYKKRAENGGVVGRPKVVKMY